MARLLLDRGHRVTVTGRDRDRLSRFAAGVAAPEALLTIAADAADQEATQAAVDATLDTFGRLDAVVANAGTATRTASPRLGRSAGRTAWTSTRWSSARSASPSDRRTRPPGRQAHCAGPLCGSTVRVHCAGPLCGSTVRVHCAGPLCGST
ncbi:SDR family oxidoreductase, partial [Nonomuraea mesophila]|uniref:SDR family oxidoreductase n=1 Tax=Nonomuraea mesophila TaxID=2530382 RepID=UPI001FE634CB